MTAVPAIVDSPAPEGVRVSSATADRERPGPFRGRQRPGERGAPAASSPEGPICKRFATGQGNTKDNDGEVAMEATSSCARLTTSRVRTAPGPVAASRVPRPLRCTQVRGRAADDVTGIPSQIESQDRYDHHGGPDRGNLSRDGLPMRSISVLGTFGAEASFEKDHL